MGMTHIQTPPKWRTLLILGRASNVPTVWSNCLAGWLIGGMAEYVVLLWLCLGGTLLHIGGMYLNDAFDVGFDRRFRQERPIPAGHIEEKTVWVLGAGAISGGFLCLVWGATVSLMIGLLLVASILLYDALHKHFSFSPGIMAACRFFLILAAFDSSGNPWQGFALWTAFAMAAYIVGLTYVARRESTGGGHRYLAMFIHRGPDRAFFSVEQRSLFLDGANGFACITGLGCLVSSIHPAFSKCPHFQNGLRVAGRHTFGGYDFDCWSGSLMDGSHVNVIFGSFVFSAIYSRYLICLMMPLTG